MIRVPIRAKFRAGLKSPLSRNTGGGAAQYATRTAPAGTYWDFVTERGQRVTERGEPVVELVRIA